MVRSGAVLRARNFSAGSKGCRMLAVFVLMFPLCAFWV